MGFRMGVGSGKSKSVVSARFTDCSSYWSLQLELRLAQVCRYIIQGYLREKELQDADHEFYDVIIRHVGAT